METPTQTAPPVALDRLVRLLRDRPGLTCTEIGETLWPCRQVNRQCMARTAGKLVARGKKAGLIREHLETKRCYRRTFYLANAACCRECGCTMDLVHDDDGDLICCDCLFEEETNEINQP